MLPIKQIIPSDDGDDYEEGEIREPLDRELSKGGSTNTAGTPPAPAYPAQPMCTVAESSKNYSMQAATTSRWDAKPSSKVLLSSLLMQTMLARLKPSLSVTKWRNTKFKHC
ncbi:hypothetical protein H072_913 [Dactylellina haptotyla CBS 200.50]|uniref:Uncharacterized protein n=1 Tax=Dactylellina haptotyla (strain CBS 200.50) TaxID=1284197 RepID=S8AVW3_DACHA|nr:hypothetical protein H072_913 [Dactylellina haptotyla CBS 200.50]